MTKVSGSRSLKRKKKFKRIVLAKKRRHRNKLVSDLQTDKQERNIKQYWKTFRKLSPKCKSDPRLPSIIEFRNYFEKLSKAKRTPNIPTPCENEGPLDYEISREELEAAGGKLKQGKAHGMDVLCNEMIIPLIEKYPRLILKLFNKILHTSDVIPDWLTGIIVPIHKDGSKMDPGNYRGITLMSCLGKLFLSIINARLMVFVLENNILGCNQLGFVPGNRTSDAHIIINPILGDVRHVRWLGGVGKFTYPCYLLKYLSNRHQTWQFCSISDEDQKIIQDISIFVITSSHFRDHSLST